MPDVIIIIISILLSLIVGVVVGYFIFKSFAQAKITGARGSAELILEDAKREAESMKKRSSVRSEG